MRRCCHRQRVFFPGFREQVRARAAHGKHSVRGIARPKLWPVRGFRGIPDPQPAWARQLDSLPWQHVWRAFERDRLR